MYLGKVIIAYFLFASIAATGCKKNKYLEYPEAKAKFIAGISKEDIQEIYGSPVSITGGKSLTTWYYDYNQIIKKLEADEEWEAFLINFKNERSYSIQPIIITKRKSS